MAQITINIPDQHLNDVVDALCGVRYQDEVHNPNYTPESEEPIMIPNPQTKGQFAKLIVLEFIKQSTKAWRNGLLISGASEQADSEVEAMGLN